MYSIGWSVLTGRGKGKEVERKEGEKWVNRERREDGEWAE